MLPDLAKFHHFRKIFNVFSNFNGFVIIWQNIEPTLANFYAIGQMFIVANGQILNNKLANWSHCFGWSLCRQWVRNGDF